MGLLFFGVGLEQSYARTDCDGFYPGLTEAECVLLSHETSLFREARNLGWIQGQVDLVSDIWG